MTPQNIIITGASSGIGEALALRYAAAGTSLGLLGRSAQRLDAVAARCRSAGAAVATAALDIRTRAPMLEWIAAFDRRNPVDLVVANAGVMEGSQPDGSIEPPDAGYALMETNVLGVLNTVQPLLDPMAARGRGQIAIVSSIAAFVPLADAPSYSASKAAVLNYGLSLRDLLAPKGVRVTVVCPGYVETPMMLRESGPKPFKMTAAEAARIIAQRLPGDPAVIVFPTLFGWSTRISGLLPERIRRWTNGPYRFTVSDANK